MLLSCGCYENVMLNIISKQSVCLCVCVKGQRGREQEAESRSDKPDRQSTTWQWAQTVHLLIFVLCSPQLGKAVSNNCEHLGNLPALHPSPWSSSPGTGGPTQLPFPLESCLEQADYHSSPRRDMRPGILSNSFTLIIKTDWQCGENTDTYHQRPTKPSNSIKKSTFPKLQWKLRKLCYLSPHLFSFCRTWCDEQNHKKSQHPAGMQKPNIQLY